ncbi:hypothetical protein GCK32_019785 [Trichostrongylus colubriformis]|uniref:Uncharacterized protein n=1 Tax=Trichostrongylus colubriformis TaxID=6319 RepID=A0AAN8FL86_TRICO
MSKEMHANEEAHLAKSQCQTLMSSTTAQCTEVREPDTSNVESMPITREHLTLLSQNYENGTYAFCGGRIHVAVSFKLFSRKLILFLCTWFLRANPRRL